MLAFLDPVRSRLPTQRGPTDLNYESWALPRTGPSRESKCGSGRGTCVAGGDDTQAEGCAGTAGCCESCDGDDLQPHLGGLGPVTASDLPGGDPDDALRLTTPGSFWGVAPDGSWIFWEGRDIGWWDEVDGPWRPDDITIDFPGPPPGPDPPGPDPDPSGFEAGTICLFGAVPLEPPDPALVDSATQDCFGMFQLAWPPHDCPAPCILEQPCTTASLDHLIEARDTFPQVVMSSASNLTASYWSDNLVLYPDGTTPDDLGDLSKYAAAATALILDNLDLLDWAVCLACSWSPFVPDDQVSAVVDCVRNGFLGEKVMYLVQTEANSSGFATDFIHFVDENATPEAGDGVVIPIAEFTFPALRYAGVAGHGTTCAGAMCSALLLSAILIHEMLHLCAGDTDAGAGLAINAANDTMDCWAVQRMAANAFQWAMAQRHPELRDLPELLGGQPVPLPALPGTPTGSGGFFDPGLLADCCDKTTDRWFMSHDPPGAPWPWRDLC